MQLEWLLTSIEIRFLFESSVCSLMFFLKRILFRSDKEQLSLSTGYLIRVMGTGLKLLYQFFVKIIPLKQFLLLGFFF